MCQAFVAASSSVDHHAVGVSEREPYLILDGECKLLDLSSIAEHDVYFQSAYRAGFSDVELLHHGFNQHVPS